MVINAWDFVQILYFALETKMFTIVKYRKPGNLAPAKKKHLYGNMSDKIINHYNTSTTAL
jgi:hypothetical protein